MTRPKNPIARINRQARTAVAAVIEASQEENAGFEEKYKAATLAVAYLKAQSSLPADISQAGSAFIAEAEEDDDDGPDDTK